MNTEKMYQVHKPKLCMGIYVQSRNVKFLAVRKIAKLTNLRIILFYYSFFGDVIINCEIANERARRKVSNNMSKLWSK